jgi:hypothetical protein
MAARRPVVDDQGDAALPRQLAQPQPERVLIARRKLLVAQLNHRRAAAQRRRDQLDLVAPPGQPRIGDDIEPRVEGAHAGSIATGR